MDQWSIGRGRLRIGKCERILRRRPNLDHRIFGRDCKSFRFLVLEVNVLLLSQAGACFW